MGGNVFKSQNGQPSTQRINRDDVLPTVKWLENLTGLSLVDNMLGTTGRKETSGDLDLAVDANIIDKDHLIGQLKKQGFTPADIKKSGDNVHLKTPINGDPNQGYVQTDFMFGNPSWQKFSLQGSSDGSPYKGMHRQLLLASIAKALGYKWSYKYGLVNRDTNEVVSQDPEVIAKTLIGGTPEDLGSVETIIDKIKNRPDYEQLVHDAKMAFAKDKLTLPGATISEGTADWFKIWRNVL